MEHEIENSDQEGQIEKVRNRILVEMYIYEGIEIWEPIFLDMIKEKEREEEERREQREKERVIKGSLYSEMYGSYKKNKSNSGIGVLVEMNLIDKMDFYNWIFGEVDKKIKFV